MSRPRMIAATQTARRGSVISYVLPGGGASTEGYSHRKEEGAIRGNASLAASDTVRTVMSILSAIGSIIVPTTVRLFHRRAMYPSSRSEIPA